MDNKNTENQINVLMIIVDEMRGDAMGCAGNPDVKTPYLDTLAQNGIRFKNAFSACPSCVPARAALYTGMSQKRNGRVGYKDGVTWTYPHTIAREFTEAGYHTHCAGKLHVHPARSLMGYMSVDLHDGYLHCLRKADIPYCEHQNVIDDYFYFLKNEMGVSADITDTGLECNSFLARPWPYEERLHPTNWVTDKCIDFLRKRDKSKPFFLTASYVRPHAPYDAPQSFFDMYDGKNLRPPEYGDWDDVDALKKHGRIFNNTTGPFDEDLIHRQMVGYYACISHVDNQIGRLYQALTDNDCLKNTLIVFVSDHGEMLSDHCLDRKSKPYNGSVKIPMIFSGPGVNKDGFVSDEITELRDVMPTLLERCGISVPDSCDGVSLFKPHRKREYIHCEHTDKENSWHAIVTSHDKYIWFSQSGKEMYFDFDKQGEKKNEINNQSCFNRISELKSLLKTELQTRIEGFVNQGELSTGGKILNYFRTDYWDN